MCKFLAYDWYVHHVHVHVCSLSCDKVTQAHPTIPCCSLVLWWPVFSTLYGSMCIPYIVTTSHLSIELPYKEGVACRLQQMSLSADHIAKCVLRDLSSLHRLGCPIWVSVTASVFYTCTITCIIHVYGSQGGTA